ncbi:hypothetical protein EV649_3118 [Kribbella sp. VKM Ac-2569]|uniref:hypothetical protein n=1 Tax=Kribbella sp. VKM Ac-2569 TaxID=2512220 RepID=UPI00102B3EBB|nr:hypothetical protein [Kribbella sp. VKM Ac-2569]RZT19978.1 hypothetical protein EV649_3118 [Kribbella sp. VKM Ac-2569]
MNWGRVRRARVVAAVYLIAFVSLYGGVACVLLAQFTGQERLALGGLPFVVSVVALFVLAWLLREQLSEPASRWTARMSNHQRAYQRLASGVELRRAWQVLRG